MVEKDNCSKSKYKIFKTLASLHSKQTHGYQFTPKCAHTRVHILLFDDMFPHALLCWITPDFCLTFPLSFPFSYHLCGYSLCEYFSSEPLCEFWQGPFYIWTDSKRGKCKTLYPLLNSITTWEASVRYLHFMASVSPFDKQSNWKLVDAQGSNWRVLAVCIVMQMGI